MTEDICPKCKIAVTPYEKIDSRKRRSVDLRYLYCRFCELVVMKTKFRETQEEEEDTKDIKITGFGRKI